MAFLDIASVFAERFHRADWVGVAAQTVFASIVACLIYGGLLYQLTRLFDLRRRAAHQPEPEAELDDFLTSQLPALAILVPAYKEEPRVVVQTLLSAALQSYQSHRVVLLIDDPPIPSSDSDAARLHEIRALPRRLQRLLDSEAKHFLAEREAFAQRRASGMVDTEAEARRLVSLFQRAGEWFSAQAKKFDHSDHAEVFFRNKILLSCRDALHARARRLSALPQQLTGREVAGAYHELSRLFDVEISSFERKRYVNLSHEANKAMNLNSYIALMGKRWRQTRTAEGLRLDLVESGPSDFEVPDTDYVITLDADSLLLPDYALRTVNLAEQPGHERLAIVQTPYSAFPGAVGSLERIAGATTDIQCNIHQGFTAWNATYWVGANALVRKAALEDIAQVVTERGYPVRVYIRDRTVIEDTESTVDLITRRWRLFNYPERLAYSATPPDFGSLIIQRRRWANGGLIILPKLLRYFMRGRKSLDKVGEAFFRIHYLASIAAVNVGLLIILAIPFTGSVRTWWLPVTALPYFYLYACDLRLAGYRSGDLMRVYALNLVLIPVNLAGVFKSLEQAWAGRKTPFGRTPKVQGRTAAAPGYIVALYVLLLHWFAQAGFDLAGGLWIHGTFVVANAALLLYGVAVFVGFRHSWEDLRGPYRHRPVPKRAGELAVNLRPTGRREQPTAGALVLSRRVRAPGSANIPVSLPAPDASRMPVHSGADDLPWMGRPPS